ncbi:MAG: type II toxin-antitoxin system VapC family toxin [Anaerolineae bacterium]|nr:type II toxin-antitoxin system VapC family toxin [Anaerolineae bacterium]
MNVLLDTHAFIGLDSIPEKLSAHGQAICKDPANRLFLSMASVWEMQIKLNIGKLNLPRPLPEIIEWQQQNNLIEILPITLRHVYGLALMPDHHRDPFDRLIIAQAQIEGLTILSQDSEFTAYPVNVIW